MRGRALILGIAVTCAYIAVVTRLVDVMLISHNWYAARALDQQVKKQEIPVKRGIIMDRRGRELAVNIDTESVYCNPSEITSPTTVASALSRGLNKNPDVILAKLTPNRKFTWLERKADVEYVDKVRALKVKGVGFQSESKRLYPRGKLASQILGYVDIDNNGLEGVERTYDKKLTSLSEAVRVVKDARGNVLSDGQQREIKGNNVRLTIDEGLQYIMEKNLDSAMTSRQAAAAVGIMMDPHTGEIFAMAVRPTYDPNNPADFRPSLRRNRAITDVFEPGSTFKIIVGTAALEEKVVKPETRFDCSAGYIEIGGGKINDAHRHGVLTFQEVIQKSSNVGTIQIALKLGRNRVYEYLKRFGFGDRTGIDLAGEVSGLVRKPNHWSGMSIGAIAIGQEVAVTPLQIVRAYSAIANGGYLVRPHIVSEVMSPDGQVVYKPELMKKKILSEGTVRVFRDMLKTVTEEGGTAIDAAVDGNQVAGKTGTAQQIDPGTRRYSKDKYVSSFVGFVPADNPKLAMIIVVYEPKGEIYGGIVAGPVFRKTASEALSYMSVPRDDAREKGLQVVSSLQQPDAGVK
jgi:cell division protein FtsI (penicillin-binding protein 3)